MKKLIILLSLTFLFNNSFGQKTNDSLSLLTLNQKIDNAVVSQDSVFLKKVYAQDFVFSHGSGKVEGKRGWLNSVAKGGFILRQHDSVKVEMHPGLAIVKGNLEVKKKTKSKIEHYHLSYIKVYAFRQKKWWLVSHSTISEYHEPDISN